MTRLLPCLVLLLLSGQACAAGLTARVDRTRLALHETLELTLETEDATQFGAPDLGPLAASFQVASTRQQNQLATVDGQARALTRWLITLQPRKTGSLEIPALSLGQWRSEPIQLTVQADDPASETLAPVFIDATLDRDHVYVQGQIVLTLRIFHSVSLYDDSSLSPLQMPNAIVERLGEPRTYEKRVNGMLHGVIEVRYAIFPQQSGHLTIPAQLFSATTVAATDGYSPFGPTPGRVTEVKSPVIPLEVAPIPPSYPKDQPWLPARRLTLVEAWTPAPAEAQVGESLTRSLLLQAEGLSSAQLPPIETAEVPGLRRYPDQPSLANEVGPGGVTGSREQRVALVPTEPGKATLPPISVTWWNTETDRLEVTELPAHTLDVAMNPTIEQPPLESLPAPVAAPSAWPAWPWQISTLILACTTLLGFGLWWHARRQPAVHRSAASGPSPRTLLDDLKRACLANDSQATRQALDAWARQQPETLADMAARFVPLSDALDELNGALYSETGQRWQGEGLWRAVQALPAQEQQAIEQDHSALPPLYPR